MKRKYQGLAPIAGLVATMVNTDVQQENKQLKETILKFEELSRHSYLPLQCVVCEQVLGYTKEVLSNLQSCYNCKRLICSRCIRKKKAIHYCNCAYRWCDSCWKQTEQKECCNGPLPPVNE